MDRLSCILDRTFRPPVSSAEYTDGPVCSRHNRFCVVDILEPGSGRVLKSLRGPDTQRQKEAWRKAFPDFGLVVHSFFLGACIDTQDITVKND